MKSLVRKINIAFWVICAVILMSVVYRAWSAYGSYTIASFLASLIYHGGFCLFLALLVDEIIVKYFKNKN